MPQGTAFNNMMRQLGGSFGISIINTYVARRVASHRLDIVSHIRSDNPLAVNRLASYSNAFQIKGFDATEAKAKAFELMSKIVTRQASFSSYLDAYFLIGLFFAGVLPLLFFVAKQKGAAVVVASSDH